MFCVKNSLYVILFSQTAKERTCHVIYSFIKNISLMNIFIASAFIQYKDLPRRKLCRSHFYQPKIFYMRMSILAHAAISKIAKQTHTRDKHQHFRSRISDKNSKLTSLTWPWQLLQDRTQWFGQWSVASVVQKHLPSLVMLKINLTSPGFPLYC